MEPPGGGGGGDECHVGNGDNKGGWITGLLTGAERILNAVLGSDSPSSSSYESDSLSDKDGNYTLALTSVPNDERDYSNQNLAIVSEIDSKETIEHLLNQETFTREESENLIKLIQSRVVDSDAQPISWQKGETTPNRELGFGFTSLSSPNPNFLSLGNSPYRTPEAENRAVKEAKKWLEDKKSSECGPCTLNTNLLDFDPETGSSPVDVAKSYMQSQKEGTKVLKRGYEGDPPDRSKRVKLLLNENSFNIPNFKKNININSASQPQAASVINEASILTAIPLDPSHPRASSSRQIYNFAPEGQKEKFDNVWMPYATCAVDPTVIKHDGGSVSKQMLQEDIVTVPSVRGGKTTRGRAGNGTRVANKPTRAKKVNNNNTEEIKEKKPATRTRRGRGAKLN